MPQRRCPVGSDWVRSFRFTWARFGWPDAKRLKLFRRQFRAGRIIATVKVSGDGQTGWGFGKGNEAKDFWYCQRLMDSTWKRACAASYP
jgi:hypothetical protein